MGEYVCKEDIKGIMRDIGRKLEEYDVMEKKGWKYFKKEEVVSKVKCLMRF